MAINTTTEIFTPRGNGIGVRLVGIYRAFRHWPVIPVFLLGLVLFAGIAAPLISPHDPNKQSLPERRLPPFWYEARTENVTRTVVQRVLPGQDARISLADAQAINPDIQIGDSIEALNVTRAGGSSKFLLGTDQLGRDILSRIIYGARISLLAAVVTLGIGGSFGVLLGLVAGWYGGVVDETIMRFVDILLAIPLVLIALAMVATLGTSLGIIVAVLTIFIWPRFARQLRGEVLQLKNMDYVALAKVAGASTPRILFVHIFPGTINTLIVVATLQVGIVILLEATLSFLGAGVPPPTATWGGMVADGRNHLAGGFQTGSWWISTFPGVAIVLTVMSLNLFGDWLRDKLDPRLRQIE
jgi:peptide/nickel transport system permease protein